MSYQASAHTELARSLKAPPASRLFGAKPRKNGYVHKHTLPTPEQAAAKYPHGTVARYILGRCRCLQCGVANSESNAAAFLAKHPWKVVPVSPRSDVERPRDADGNVSCRFCGVARTAWGITRHENACEKNPGRGVRRGSVIVHRVTGERAGEVFARVVEARAECARLNKRDAAKLPSDLVSAARVRRHLQMLSEAGVGVKSIHAECGVASSVLDRLRRGMILRTRRSTEEKILAVKPTPERLRGRGIPSGPTMAMLEVMVAVGYRKGWIAQQLGAKCKALQIGRSGREIRADKARLVKALYDRLWAADAGLRALVDPAGERERAAAAAAEAATRASREKLARALKGWDADEFAVRFSRLGDVS